MGEIVSKSFHDYPKGFGPDITNTQNKNWITKHAELTNLTVVECQRLWTRFQQLGCDDDGILHMNHIGSAGKFKVITTSNILTNFVYQLSQWLRISL